MPKSNTIKANVLKETPRKKPSEKTLRKKDSKKTGTKKGKSNLFQFLKDERFVLIAGIFMILLSIYLFTSFSSYLWNYLRIGVGADNAGGYFGQRIGNLFIQQWFGAGAYAFCIFLFIPGLFIVSGKFPKKPLLVIWHSIFWLCWLPITLAVIFPHEPWNVLGGAFGLSLRTILYNAIGTIFTFIILSFTGICYLILGFNIHLHWKKSTEEKGKISKTVDGTGPKEDLYNTEEFAVDDTEEPVIFTSTDEKNDTKATEIITLKPAVREEPDDQQTNSGTLENGIDFKVETAKEEEVSKKPAHPKPHYGLDTTYDPRLDLPDFLFPDTEFLEDYGGGVVSINKLELEENKNKIVKTLNNYAIKIEKIQATVGPTITLYEIIPAPGIRINKIKNLEDDIALSLSALGIRIIAPIPGKGTIGIEVPNRKPQTVSMRSIINSAKFQENQFELPIGLGKTIANESFVADLTKMPHLLIAGATGQGKSVGLNAILTSLLYKKHPSELKLILVDPKKVELTLFNRIERHYLAKLPDSEEAIITDTRKVVRTLNSLIIEMENRYNLLKDAQVRNIKEYNQKFTQRKLNPEEGHHFLPYIVLVVDEFADLIMTAGKEIEAPITRLAQLARAIGIHLIIATQRPSVNIITGTIKANFPARIAFRVVSKMDSRTILDTGGADQLVGRGDMLLSSGSDLTRLQCAFVDTHEIEKLTDYIGSQRGYPEAFSLPEVPDEEGDDIPEFNSAERDPLFEDAARVIVSNQHGSTSLLQRKLKLGYNRAGRLIDQLEAAGIVGPFEGSKAREVKIGSEMALDQFLKDLYTKEGEKPMNADYGF
ncbi:MAG: DNA translocase FtsK [Bacteroidia bacterium]|nr:DNA translocase FtsK [Bacteroidia bacterium]